VSESDVLIASRIKVEAGSLESGCDVQLKHRVARGVRVPSFILRFLWSLEKKFEFAQNAFPITGRPQVGHDGHHLVGFRKRRTVQLRVLCEHAERSRIAVPFVDGRQFSKSGPKCHEPAAVEPIREPKVAEE
jgi:hypothetical protein